jgi:acetyl esterase/lipase
MTERASQDPVSTPAMLAQFAADYLAGADPKTPLASPLFAPLAGLPPLLIQVGTADLLLSDAERLATAATQAGVDVTLQVGQGLPHVYQLLLGTPRQPRPPSRSARSCGPGTANQSRGQELAPAARQGAPWFIGRGPGSARRAPPVRRVPGRGRRSTGSRARPDHRRTP